MKLHFHKYQGTGNDFVMVDNRLAKFKPQADQVKAICDRRFGIGADGLILLETHPELDFEMNYFNADGTKSFCGNGSRCVVRFAESLGLIQDKAHYLAIDGEHSSYINQSEVSTLMKPVKQVERIGDDYFIHTGSPHYIVFVDDIHAIDIVKEAHKIRYSEKYRENGTNVNFVEMAEREVLIRTYERGVEDETLSCGTGVTAVAIAWSHLKDLKGNHEIPVKSLGGELRVSLTADDDGYTNIRLIGPAEKVYEGDIEL